MKIAKIGYLAIFIVFLQIGCASKETKIAKKHLIEAKTTIGTAKLMGAESAAPSQMSSAEKYYRKADDDFHKEPRSNRLVSTLRQSTELKKKSAENALLAKKEAERAIQIMKEQENRIRSQKDSLEREVNQLTSTIQEHQKELKRSRQKKEEKPKALYMKAFYLFHDRDYETSRKTFERYLEVASNDLGDNAQFWIGECYYMQKKYRKAKEAYQAVLSNFPKSNKTADSLLKLGLSYRRLKNYEKSKQSWRSLIKRYPKSQAAAIARKYLGRK